MSKTKTQNTQEKPKTLHCQSKAQVQTFIKAIGDNHRKIEQHNAKMNDEIAKITAKYAERIAPLQALNDDLSEAVKIWCENNRNSLLTDGLKTANLITGEVAWRLGKPSVVCKVTPDLIARLERFGLERFIRVKKELDKTAILKEPDAVADIQGVSVKAATEEFIITPFVVRQK